VHPVTGATHSWSAPLPDDMKALLAILRDEREIKLNKAKAQTPLGAAMEDDDDDWDEDDYDVETHYIR